MSRLDELKRAILDHYQTNSPSYGDVMFIRGFLHGRGCDLVDIDQAMKEVWETGDFPSMFDMVDAQSADLLRRRGVEL